MRPRFAAMSVVACVLVQACATILNPGQSRTVPEQDRSVKVARISLKRVPPGLKIYDGDRQVPIWEEDQDNHDSMARICVLRGGSPGDCASRVYFPVIELDRSVPHTLRLINDAGDEATVTVRAHMHWRWVWYNCVWGVFMPVGWVVDASSGRWTYFGRSLDVQHAFEQSSRQASTR